MVGAAIASISVNPFVFRWMLALEPRLARSKWLASRTERLGARANALAASNRRDDPGAIVVGYGPVGQTVTRLLADFEINPMILERNVDAVVELQQAGKAGNVRRRIATVRDSCERAGLESAAYLIVTLLAGRSPMAHHPGCARGGSGSPGFGPGRIY